MIQKFAEDYFGDIQTYPHIIRERITIFRDSNKGTAFFPVGYTGMELLKHDDKFIYLRDFYNSSNVIVFDEDGYKVKDISINELNF